MTPVRRTSELHSASHSASAQAAALRPRTTRKALFIALATAALALPAVATAVHYADGAVYTLTNAADGNRVVVYDRHADGRLGARRTFSTGGNGSGSGMGNQGAVTLSDSGQWLLAVNAGSNSVSVFFVLGGILYRTGVEPSGGTRPVIARQNAACAPASAWNSWRRARRPASRTRPPVFGVKPGKK